MIRDVEKHVIDGIKYHVFLELKQLKVHTRAEEFDQNYVRSAAKIKRLSAKKTREKLGHK